MSCKNDDFVRWKFGLDGFQGVMGITRGLVTVLLAFNVFRFGLKEMNGEDGTAVVEKVHISSISLSALLILGHAHLFYYK